MVKPQKRISASYSVKGIGLKTLMHYKVFRETYNFLKKSQWWNKEQIEKYQIQELSKLLIHAYDNVPYYTKIFDKLGLKPKDINFTDKRLELFRESQFFPFSNSLLFLTPHHSRSRRGARPCVRQRE